MIYIKNKRMFSGGRSQRKLFKISFFVMIIFLGVIGSLIFSLYSRNINERNYMTNLEKYKSIKSSQEYKIEMAKIISEIFAEDENIQSFASFRGEYNDMDFFGIMKIKELLAEHQSKIEGVGLNMYIASFDNDFALSYDSTFNISGFETQTLLSKGKIENLFKIHESGIHYSYVLNENNQFVFVCKNSYLTGNDIYFAFVFEPEDVRYSLDDKGKCFMYVTQSKKEISNEEITNLIEWIYINDSKNIMNFSYKDEIFFYSKFKPVTNVIIVGGYQKENTYLIAGLIFILWILLSFLTALFISEVVYRPFIRLFEIMGKKDDDFEGYSIEKAIYGIEELLGKYALIEDVLEKQNRLIRDKKLLDILNGSIWGENVQAFMTEYKMEYLEKLSMMFILQIYEEKNYEHVFSLNDLNAVMESICVVVEQEFAKRGINCARITVGMLKTVIISQKTIGTEELLNSLCDSIYTKYGIRVVAVIGNEYKSIEGLCAAYEELRDFSLKAVSNTNQNVILLKERGKSVNDRFKYSIGKELELIDKCINGDKVYLMRIIREIFERNTSDEKKLAFKSAMIVTAERILDTINETPQKVFGEEESYYHTIKNNSQAKNVYDDIKWIFSNLVDYIIERKKKILDSDLQCKEILRYIKENLHTDLSLDDIKRHFNVSSTYINNTLKNGEGTTFKKYLNECRINKACEILREDKFIKIAAVASAVGFNSTASFVRVFQQSMQITPSQYREKFN